MRPRRAPVTERVPRERQAASDKLSRIKRRKRARQRPPERVRSAEQTATTRAPYGFRPCRQHVGDCCVLDPHCLVAARLGHGEVHRNTARQRVRLPAMVHHGVDGETRHLGDAELAVERNQHGERCARLAKQ